MTATDNEKGATGEGQRREKCSTAARPAQRSKGLAFYSFDDIRAAADCAKLAADLYGAHVRNGRCNAAWRGGDGPENVSITRDKWYDHVQEVGGGALELTAFRFGGDIQQAQAYLGQYYGLSPRMMTGAQPTTEGRYDKLIREGYREVARYKYADTSGAVRHETVRLQHPDQPGKEFVQGHQNGTGFVWSVRGVDTILYNLAAIAESEWVIVCEGEKAADRLISLGLPATTSPMGAGKWRKSYSEALRGKDVAIFPDNDEPGREHAHLVAKALTGVANEIKIVGPLAAREKSGIDDWLDEDPGRGAAEVEAAIRDAEIWTPPPDNEAGICVKGKTDGRKATSPDNGKKGGRPEAPTYVDTAVKFLAETHQEKGFPTARHYRDEWHLFESGGWLPTSNDEMQKRLLSWLQSKGDPLRKYATINYARNVLANLAGFTLCGIPATRARPCWLSTGEDASNVVAFSNGVAVDLWRYAEALARGANPEGCEREHTPDLFSADGVSYEWQPHAKAPEMFLRYLRRVCPVQDVFDAVRRMLGLLVVDTAKYEVFWQLYGMGANGKTVLLDVIESLVGRQNVSRVSLECLAPGTRFQTFPLTTAKVNISGELGTDLGRAALAAMEGEFKHAVSGGTIEVERKGIDKTFERCRARFVMSGNSLPTFMDKSDAIWRRKRIIPFDVQIPEAERDPDLARKIVESELPGILRWALDGLADVIRLRVVPDCERGAKLKAEHRSSCDHEREFLTDRFEPGTREDRMPSADLYREYMDWMCANGYRPLGAARFKQRVESIFPMVGYGPTRINDDVVKGVVGIRRHVTDVTAANSAYGKPNFSNNLGLSRTNSGAVTSVTSDGDLWEEEI